MASKTTTSTNQMYPALEEGWNNVLGGAESAYNNSDPSRLAPLNSYTTNAFNQTNNLASGGVPNLNLMYDHQAHMLQNGGMTGQMQQAYGLLGNFANGAYNEDPRLQSVIANERTKATNAALTSLGGGRYGSNAIGSGIGNAQAAATDQLMLQSNENARNRQLQAAGQMGSLAQAGAGNQATWGAMSGAMNDLRYDGASRLAGIGDYMQNRAQTRIDNKTNFPWQNLQNYAGILSGMGGQGSTQVTKQPGASAAQSILGGAAMGAGIGSKIPGLGAGWGGILGGAVGAFA